MEGRMTDGPLQHSEAGKGDWEGTKKQERTLESVGIGSKMKQVFQIEIDRNNCVKCC